MENANISTTDTETLTLSAVSETKGCLFDKEVTVTLNVNITAPEFDDETLEQRKGVDIVCVIDKSGSMSGKPFELVKETLSFMVDQLKAGDRLSLVTFNSDAALVFELTDMAAEGKTKALNEIKALQARGGTNLSSGIMMGIQQLSSRVSVDVATVTSLMVFTDGQANEGIKDPTELVTATVNALDGVKGAVSLHTFGFTQNHNPGLLTKLAEAANGMFYYLATTERIPEVFADCLGGLLSVVAMNVILEAQTSYHGATITSIHTPFAIRQLVLGQQVSIEMGQMYSEQSRDILFEVKLPAVTAVELDAKIMTFQLQSLNRIEQVVSTTAFATIDRVEANSEAIKEIREEVVKQKARVETALAMKQALSHHAAGRASEAKQVLDAARTKMQTAGFGVYATQLDAAHKEVTSGRTGYLHTNARAHDAQASAAQDVLPEQAQAQGSRNNKKDMDGYSNAYAKKKKYEALRMRQAKDDKKSAAPSSSGNVQ